MTLSSLEFLLIFFSKSIRSSSGQAIFNFRKFQRNKGECCCFLDRQYLIPQYICVIKVNAFSMQ